MSERQLTALAKLCVRYESQLPGIRQVLEEAVVPDVPVEQERHAGLDGDRLPVVFEHEIAEQVVGGLTSGEGISPGASNPPCAIHT